MKALLLEQIGHLRIAELSRPTPASGEVLVRVGFCGVCGSDIPRVFVKGTYRFPLVCGHEIAGTVEECGPDVEGVQPGDRVAVFPLIWCGKCRACERGQYVQCRDYDYLGSRTDGGFAQFVRAPARNLLKIPADVSLEAGAMTEPAAVALHALRRAGGCFAGESVAVFGLGPIGLLVAQWARALGAERLILFDIVPQKLAMAASLGFTNVYDARQESPEQAVARLTDGVGADVCIEAAGVPATTVQALQAAGQSGRVVLLGNPAADVTLSASLISQVMRRELTVLGTWNSDFSVTGNKDDWHTSLQAMARGTIQVEPLISHRVGLEEAIETLRQMHQQSGLFSKVLVCPHARSH